MVKLHSVDGRALTRAVGLNVNLPVVAKVAVEGEEVIAAGGLAWDSGRCFLWFLMETPQPQHRFKVLSEARKMMARAVQLGEASVYTISDPQYPTSKRLLKLLGFEFHSVEDGKEVHIWHS